MAVDLTNVVTLSIAGDKTFVMPTGFDSNVEIHCWGAGGGASYGVLGGGGGYASTVAQIPAGSVVRLQVGQPGANGGRGNNPPSPGGTHPTYTRYRGGSAGSSTDEDGDTGSGGGGGGASAVVVDDSPVCVGAGGGGAGGPGDDSGSGTPGNPGGVYPGQPTNIYPVTLNYAWCQFMNDYAVWGPVAPYTKTLNFPTTGTYTFAFAVDNYGNVQVDGSDVISLAGTVGTHFTTVHYANVTVSAGNHTITTYATNTGGPAGVAVRILKPDLTELDNSRNWTVNGGLTNTTDGGNSPNAWTSGGGGGGGYYGGLAGTSYGDDAGNAPGGNGGQNYGAVIQSGSGATGAGKDTVYYPRTIRRGLSTTTIVWSETIYSTVRSVLVGPTGITTTPGKTLSLPYGETPPGTILQPDGTAISNRIAFGLLRTYSVWTPSSPISAVPVSYIGNAGYPGYIVMVFTRKPGLQIKNPDGSGNWVTVQNSYVKTSPPRPGVVADNKVFSTVGTTSYFIPKEVRVLTLTYLSGTGFQSQIIPVTPGSLVPVTVGDFGQVSKFGDFTIPAYNKLVFRYVGNIDHLTTADVQIATPLGATLTTSGYNTDQQNAAAAAGISFTYTYEGWHGDLYSTLTFNTVRTDQILNNFQIVAGGGGRAQGPSVTYQPTIDNNYVFGMQILDTAGGEGGYDCTFTLQQQGYFRITYDLPVVVSGWKDIQQIYVKQSNKWKLVSQLNDIVITNYK